MPVSLRRRRLALFALFLMPGLAMSSWVTRTPAVRDLLDASTAEMGMVLAGLSVGSMLGILSSGPLVLRLGTRPVITIGSSLVVVSMPVIALGAALGQPVLTAFGLALFGGGMGAGEVAMNVEGGEVEKLGGRPFLPAMHGFFSFGTVLGALLGILANAAGFPVIAHLVLAAVVGAGLLAYALPAIPSGTGKVTAAERAGRAESPRPALWKDARLLLLGPIVLAMALAAVVLWGLGASLGFPLALSAAGDSGPDPAARMALTSTVGYLAFLVGPPVLGLLGEQIGLRGALIVPLAVVLVAAVLAPAVAPRPTARVEEEREVAAADGAP